MYSTSQGPAIESHPLHRHQSSLEGILNFSVQDPVFENDDHRQHAESLFASLLQRLQAEGNSELERPYRRLELVRLFHHFSRTRQSKDVFLKSFFDTINVSLSAGPESTDVTLLPPKVVEFTDYLFYNFFLPLKASSGRTPQPTPAALSVPSYSGDQALPGSTARLATLRRDCLLRDQYRCVISRKFEMEEAVGRIQRAGANATDNEGNLISSIPGGGLEPLQVAHILPHSLMNREGNAEMIKARQNAIAILAMFDIDVCHLIEGPNIDRPTNAITLTYAFHQAFGSFRVYFQQTDTEHTYTIESTLPGTMYAPALPVTRALLLSEHHTIDPPSARLFALHAAVCRMLHLTGAGECCDKILRDTEELLIKEDGSTNIASLAALRLGGWWNGVVA